MTEEPYRWMEAISNRREYIDHQLAGGSPIAALTYQDGIVLFTVGRERQKIFEIYDRIAMGAIGHPGDLERLRMSAIELASTEGFARSTDDVSLRRLVTYSLSPALKAAFEQIYGPPYLARMLFAELGMNGAPNLYVRLDYDGSMHTNGAQGRTFAEYAALSGSAAADAMMEKYLGANARADAPLKEAIAVAANAWSVGRLAYADADRQELPGDEQIAAEKAAQFPVSALEAAVLDRKSRTGRITYRSLPEQEIRELLETR